eukprot:TRINITY_DN10848_c0_g2_i1.p1 TRINITY_DN10848_c0_g2~~TRINITY_DN10848_c0_g2_i1.p1  ORF type:complete len:179 (+),score=5.26 TRINITY_DN10848_c0_g2_i1:35-538(+)
MARHDTKALAKKALPVPSEYKKALFQSILWILKEDLALDKLHSLMKLLYGQQLIPLQGMGKDLPYCSSSFISAILKCIAKAYESDLFARIQNSEYISILVDESTDKTGEKVIILDVKYIESNNDVKTTFCSYLPTPESDAKSIFFCNGRFPVETFESALQQSRRLWK